MFEMLDKGVFPFLLALAKHYLVPNAVLIVVGMAAFGYYQTSVSDINPTWRTVAAGSMALAGALAGLGYRDFIRRMKIIEDDLMEDRKKRDLQHKANVAAIIALALAGQDRKKVDEVIEQLLRAQT